MYTQKENICGESCGEPYILLDFGKAAYGQLVLELTGSVQDFIEVVIGEEVQDGHLIRLPGCWRTYKSQWFVLADGVRTYRFNIPPFHSAYGINPWQSAPIEYGGEIAPFRYVELHHYYGKVTATRLSFYCDMNLSAAAFECPENPWFPHLWDFCRYSIRATSVFNCYVDGERERMPYEGDAYIAQLSHFCMDTNFMISKNTIEYFLGNGRFTWPTEWHLLVPALIQDYLLYSGDAQSVQKWLPELPKKLLPQLRGEDGLLYPIPGDKIRDIIDWPPGPDQDGYECGKTNFVPNAFYIGALQRTSELTGEIKYAEEAERVKAVLRNKMWHNGLPVDTIGSAHTSLHTAVSALKFGVAFTEEERKRLCLMILDKGMCCSVYFAQFFLETCFKNGLDEFAVARLNADDTRSWKNMLRSGSTITTEGWDETLKPYQDWTHSWGTAPGNIIPRWYCGIRPVTAGFRSFVVAPSPIAGEFYYRQPTLWGAIEVNWENKSLHVQFCLPNGTVLPLQPHNKGEFTLPKGCDFLLPASAKKNRS